MCTLFNKSLTRSLVLLTACALCACAPQSYYSSASYSGSKTTPYRANPYRRASYSPYRDYNREYYEALRQRRMRALADSYRGIYNGASTGTSSSSSSSSGGGVSSNAQRYYSSSRLPAAAAAISAVSNDDGSGGGSSTTTSIYASSNYDRNKNNYPRKDGYTSSNRLTDNNYSTGTASDQKQDSTATTNRQRVSKADQENAKFEGIRNQESDEQSPKAFSRLKRRKLFRCLPFGRDAQGDEVTPPPEEQGRILWDVNVYNIYGGYPPVNGGGCGGFGGGLGGLGALGGLGGGGLLSDPIAAGYEPPNRFNNFLQLFAPGILQNALAATVRPPPIPIQSEANDLTNDPEVDPGYNPVAARPPPVRRPYPVYYDSAGAAPITPAQLVGGVATTVNGIIQQLTGNVQPVYPSYRSLSYGK